MQLPAPSIVIFDMDGTTVRHLNPALLHVLERLDNVAFNTKKFFKKLFSHKPAEAFNFCWETQGNGDFKKPKLFAHRAIHKFRRKSVDQIVEPCPGIYELLELLKSQNIPMAIASNGLGAGYGHEVLETFDLEKYFGATIFREDIQHSKPHPEAILLALKNLGLRPGEKDVVWYIGDRNKDVRAALAAQKHVSGKIVPLAYGLRAAITVLEQALPPESIILSYGDIRAHLETMFTSPVEEGSEI